MKKIVSLLMAVAMLTASASAMATTEGIVQGDVMMTSAEGIEQGEVTTTSTEEEVEKLAKYTGVVKEIAEDSVIVIIEDAEYKFMLAEGVELGEIAEGDTVEIESASLLETKDIKEAASITKVEADTEKEPTEDEETAVPQETVNNYNSYNAVVNSVEEGMVTVTIEEDMVVTFRTSEKTTILNMNSEEAAELKADDKVIVVSTSLLNTKDIKFADVIVINNEEKEQAVYYDKFDIVEEQLISADGKLVLNVEDATEYAGKNLVVFYSATTMSIPAQTAPEMIVVVEVEEEATPAAVSISFNVGDQVLAINGTDVELEIAPYIVGEGTTLVPLRVISEAFGADVAWDGETQTVHIVDGEKAISLQIANNTAFVDGESVLMEVAPELLGTGVTMVPLRFISETFAAAVDYVDETQLITVSR